MFSNLRSILVLITLLCGINNAAWADLWNGSDKTAPAMTTNNGSSEDLAIQITNAAELAWFGDQMRAGNTANGKTYGNKYWKLTADIDLGGKADFSGNDWAGMIGNTTSAFCGHFDGGSHTVSNIQVKAMASAKYYGLFTSVQGKDNNNHSDVKNLTINGAYFQATGSMANTTRVGALAGYAKWSEVTGVTISNVKYTYTGGITNENDLGGAIGCTETNVTVSNVSVTTFNATFTGTTTNLYVAGLIGKINSQTTVTGCSTSGVNVVYNTIANASRIAGLIGYTKGAADVPVSVKNCTATNTTINLKAGINNGSFIGGLIAQTADNTQLGDDMDANKNTVTSPNITVSGEIKTASYIGGAVGDFAGASGKTSNVNNLNVTSPTVTVSKNSVANTYVGAAFGRINTYATVTNVEVSSPTVSYKATDNPNFDTHVGSFAGGIFGVAAERTDVTKVTITGTATVNLGTDNTSELKKVRAGVIGQSTTNVLLENWNIASSNVDVKGSLTTSGCYLGGFAGYLSSANNAPLTITNVKITGTSTVGIGGNVGVASYVGGYAGQINNANNTNAKITISNVGIGGATALSVGGNVTVGSYFGGFVGNIKGVSQVGALVSASNVALAASGITVTGNVTAGSYFGGLAGSANVGCTFDTWSVGASTLNINGDVTAGSYIGGAFGNIQGAANYPTSVSNVTIASSTITTGTTADNTFASSKVGVVGQVTTNVELDTWTVTGNSSVTINGSLKTGGSNIGGFAGYVVTAANAPITIKKIDLQGNSTLNVTKDMTDKGSYLGGVFGQIVGADKVENVKINIDDVKLSDSEKSAIITVGGSITAGSYLGGFAGCVLGRAIAGSPINIDNVSLPTSRITVTGNVTGGSYFGGLAGNVNTGCNLTNWKVTTGATISLGGTLTATSYFGGAIGNITGSATYPSVANTINVKDPSITIAGAVSGSPYVGGLVGYLNTSKLETANITGTNTITFSSTISPTSYIGGGIGNITGVAAYPTVANAIKVNAPTITLNGNVTGALYLGGLAGYQTISTLTRSDVTGGTITLNTNHTNNMYIGGAVGYQNLTVAPYSSMQYIKVSGLNIQTSGEHTYAKGNKALCVGGVLGYTGHKAATATAAANLTDINNCVADNVDINLGGFKPEAGNTSGNQYNQYQDAFVVGGVIGRINTPQQLPEHLFYSGKINAPFAAVGPVVGVFTKDINNAAYAYDDYTGANAAAITEAEWNKQTTWLYSDYKLGLSSAVTDQTARTKNYDAANVDGEKYLSVKPSTLIDYNKIGATVKPSKTVLPYNVSGLNSDFGIFPAWNTNSITYPNYYMYYMQGINRGTNIESAEKAGAISMILSDTRATINITPSGANRGFEKTFTASTDTSVDSYVWYYDGKKQASTGNTCIVQLTGKDATGAEQYVTVMGIKDGQPVAMATVSAGKVLLRVKDANKAVSTYGTKANPYVLGGTNGAEELQLLSHLSTLESNVAWEGEFTSANHYNKAYYELDDDIDLSGIANFTPIAFIKSNNTGGVTSGYHQNFVFDGVFNGNGHTISGLKETWSAGIYNTNNQNVGWGLFSMVGNTTATIKVGDSQPSPAVIKNLVISGATLTHDTQNASFFYNNGTSGNGNFAMVGVLAGIVSSNTVIQNIEISGDSKITDATSDGGYNLASKGIYVGGAIGSVQTGFNKTDGTIVNTKIEHVAAKVNITIAYPKFNNDVKSDDLSQLNVGGIIGRYISTGAVLADMQEVMPKHTIFSGTINAPKAWISPVVAAVRFNVQNNVSNNFNNFSRQWEGNNNSAATQLTVENAHYFNYVIEENIVNNSFPLNTCARGSRTVVAHSDGSENYNSYNSKKYQGVNYGAIYVESNTSSLELLNNDIVDGYHWVWNDGGTFVKMTTDEYKGATLSREGNVFTASLTDNSDHYYKWYARFDVTDAWTLLSATEKTYTIPASPKAKYFKAEVSDDNTYWYPTMPQLVDATKDVCNPSLSYVDNATNRVFTVALNNGTTEISHLAVEYEWFNWQKEKIGGATTNTYNLPQSEITAGHNIIWCKVTIKELGKTVAEYTLMDGATVVYVNGDGYSGNGAGTGVDTNNGLSPATPVKTIDKANSLLKTVAQGGTIENNIIVVMGTLNPTDPFRSKGSNPATITGYYNGTDYAGVINIKQFNPGSNEHVVNPVNQEQNGQLQNGHHCYVLGDTKFENLTFYAVSNTEGNNFIELHGHDAIFGKGLKMRNFNNLSSGHGNMDKKESIPEFTIILTGTNLIKDDINAYTQRISERGKPQTVTFQSGHYGRLMGGRFTEDFFNETGNDAHSILASPANPIWAVVNIEIEKDNDPDGQVYRNEDTKDWKNFSRDINCIIAGLTDGTMYGDYQINFYGGNVAYIVGGNQGNPVNNGTARYTPVGGTEGAWGQWPNASYFGRTVITIDDKSTTTNTIKGITVGDLYAGGLGRKVQNSSGTYKADVDMYMYGRTEVNVKRGTISGSVYGGGVGGVMGLNPWDAHVPYATTTEVTIVDDAIQDKVQYGKFGSASMPVGSPMVDVILHNLKEDGTYAEESLNLGQSSTTVNIMGGIVNGSVYGGGYGKVTDMPNQAAMQGIGSVFGTANVNISGGTINGSVYGGSRGDTQYYNVKNQYGQTITHIAEMNGTVNLNISGNTTITGNIYGAGQGIPAATRKANAQDVAANRPGATAEGVNYTEDFADIARTGDIDLDRAKGTYKSEVNITIDLPADKIFAGNIYGGGALGKVDGNTNILIKNGIFTGNIYGAGEGETQSGIDLDKTKVNGSTNLVVENGVVQGQIFGGGDRGRVSDMANVTINGGIVYHEVFGGGNVADVGTAYVSGEKEEWAAKNGTKVVIEGDNVRVYGDIFGGGNNATVNGNTAVFLNKGYFGGNIFGGGNGTLDNNNVPVTFADVTNDTEVHLEGAFSIWDVAIENNNIWTVDNKNTVPKYNIVEWNGKWGSDNYDKFVEGDEKNPIFKNNHNVYGGGNYASRVGGDNHVYVEKGFANSALLSTDIWKNSFYDNNNPHFYVFGGGYGPFTTSNNTYVNVGVMGEYEDNTTTDQLAKKFLANYLKQQKKDETDDEAMAKSASPRYATGAGNDDATLGVYDNSFGIPLYTVLGVLGGGYSGLISGNTNVTVGGDTFIHRVYGGGYGSSVDYGKLPVDRKASTLGDNLPAGMTNAYSGYTLTNLRDILGEVGGKTDVTVNGAYIFGDVFGGGAGVVSKEINSSLTDFVDMARVRGNGVTDTQAFTKVTISDRAQIYGSVYGGGDIANVGLSGSATVNGDNLPSLNTSTGALTNVHSFVNVIGGDIYGEVFGGGGGRQLWTLNDAGTDFIQTTASADVLGRVEGNTLVHIANTPANQTLTGQDEEPNIWQRIYGGGNLGSVNGNTKVWVEGGNIGHNIIGGGNGYAATDNAYTEAGSIKGTYANVYGNTNIVIDGGSIIWDKVADSQGNVTTWSNASKQLIKTEKEMRELFASDPSVVRDMLTPYLDKRFFDYAEGDNSNMKFPANHNIYGGGRYACHVGSYSGSPSTLTENTGLSTVTLNHSLLTDENLLDIRTVAGLCWYAIVNNTSEPQFSVFGGGYGANTKVGESQVDVQIGKDNVYGTNETPVDYVSKTADDAAWAAYEANLQGDWANVTNEEKTKYYGGDNENAYRRYRTARYALSLGVPNHTYMNIYGGGYSGYVENNTDVNVSGRSGMRNVYGGGLGAVKDRSIPHVLSGRDLVEASLLKGDEGVKATFSNLDYGKVGGNTNVNIQGGIISLNVYGGGAGVESRYLTDAGALATVGGTLSDFPLMAHVAGKTNVNITGTVTVENGHQIDGTVIYGKVFGGGDVANVGGGNTITSASSFAGVTTPAAIEWVADNGDVDEAATDAVDADDYEGDVTFTSTIKIDGGLVMSQILAGGSGRPTTACANYESLGGIYGNSRVVIKPNDNPAWTPWLWNNIYGGGENGTVYGNSLVSISGGHLGYNIFGGGWGNVDGENVSQADIKRNSFVHITGGEYVLTQMWMDDTRSWGVNNQQNSPQFDYDTKKFLINHNIYGGGNYACEVGGDTYVKMTKGLLKSTTQVTYGGTAPDLFQTDEWRDVYNKTGSPHFSVYGGGFGANTNIKGNTNLDIAMTVVGDNTIHNANTSDGSRDDLSSIFFSEQAVMDITGGGYSGSVAGKAHVKIGGETFARRILGGGFYGAVGETLIDITSVDCTDIFGGGLMGNIGTREGTTNGTAKTSGNGVATINLGTDGAAKNADIWIHKNIYGANDVSGSIYSAANINVYGGHILGNVYGAGNGNYLYAQGDKNTKQVTVNEYYKTAETTYDLVYTVPSERLGVSIASASEASKMVNVNSYRPATQNVRINLQGTSTSPINIAGNVFGGGNSATVNEIYSGHKPTVNLNLGNYLTIGGVYLGCDGDAMFDDKTDYMNAYQDVNKIDLTHAIDWVNDPANKAVSTQYLPVAENDRPKVYKTNLDLYFQPVEMAVQPTVTWNGSADGMAHDAHDDVPAITALSNTIIGTFVCGGNRGNMNVTPVDGKIVDITFPAGLTILEKIVGGCNNANIMYKNTHHEGGYLLGQRNATAADASDNKDIALTVKCQFLPSTGESGVLEGGNVYGGCYKSGTINGDIFVDIQTNMLTNITAEELAANKAKDGIALANVYGAGYGNDSYVYGNTTVLFGKGIANNTAFPVTRQVPTPAKSNGFITRTLGTAITPVVVNGAAANFIYGGGQQGNLIGNSLVRIYNGHVASSVCGGSYAGYMWGSTQVLVGYPKYYTCQKSGVYNLKRADKWNTSYQNFDTSDVIKQKIYLMKGDVVSEEVYQAIEANTTAPVLNSSELAAAFFETTTAPASPLTWNDIDINIAEAVYGGGYSLASGSSVAAGTYTVKKYDADQNLDSELSISDLSDINTVNNGNGTKGFGGNTTVLVWDRAAAPTDGSTDKDHIAISTQSMKEVKLADGADLFGYYYDDNGTYRYIYQEDTYFYDANGVDRLNYFKNVWESDSEGGMYGDGHLSFAEGFRAGEINGYGFAGANPNGAKLINTFQRMDILRVQDCSLALLGARDYTVTELSTTPYSIARVGELQMRATSNVKVGDGTTLYKPATGNTNVAFADGQLLPTTNARSRNYMGFSNNIHYIGAIDSDVPFTDPYHYGNKDASTAVHENGKAGSSSYRAEKQAYIDAYKTGKDETEFQKRNDGTAKNMIGIASGYAMKLQNVYTTDEANTEKIFYGPIVGVVEMNLINVREEEGGGYVYADNIHHRASVGTDVPADTEATEDFLETSGNFVFPYDAVRNRYIVDDCYPINYYVTNSEGTGPADDTQEKGIHYWYVTGFNYYYNAHITGYTYDSSTAPLYFNNDNKDGLLILSGAKEGQTVTLKSIKWRSNHVTAKQYYVAADLTTINEKTYVKSSCDKHTNGEGVVTYTLKSDGTSIQANVGDVKIDNKGYLACDLETSKNENSDREHGFGNTKNGSGIYDHYILSMSAPGDNKGEYDSSMAGFTNIPMNNTDASILPSALSKTITCNDPAITFQLKDQVNNEGNEYYQKYMAQPCKATVELSVPALKDEVSHPATEDDVTAGKAEKVGDKVVDTPVAQRTDNLAVQYFYTNTGTDANPVYTKLADNAHLANDGTKYYYLGYNKDYVQITDLSEVKVWNEKRQAYLSVTSAYPLVNYADLEDYNNSNVKNITQTEFDAFTAEQKIKYPAVAAADIVSGGSGYFISTPRYYNYTIYLTIDYVLGPSHTGNLKIHNCALPGEMIKIDKGDIKLTGDQTFSQTGTTYKFGKIKQDGDDFVFVDDPNYPVYNYNIEADGSSDILSGVRYDKDGDYILVPAYYFMNGYGVQYSFKVNNLPNDFDVKINGDNTLLVHNYHRMLPRSSSGEEYALDQHLDLAAKRHKLETAAGETNPLPQPRIYLVDNKDLNKFGTFLTDVQMPAEYYANVAAYNTAKSTSLDDAAFKALTLSEKIKTSEANSYGQFMQFFLQRDITAIKPGDKEDGKTLTPYVAPTNFKGILHGDGHVINGLGDLENKYLLTANNGNIYNLGLTTGVITNGDAAKVTAATAQDANDAAKADLNNSLYHCCYTYAPVPVASPAPEPAPVPAVSPAVVYRMDGTAFTGYTQDDWRYGKVAYDLNQYYLDKRYVLGADGASSAAAYVENYYSNGDYLYADYSGDNHYKGSEFLRTSARPNYGEQSSLHNTAHTIDASRAVGYTAATGTPGDDDYSPASCTGYQPLFEAAKVSGSSPVAETAAKNDYLFWGQRQDANTKLAGTDKPGAVDAGVNVTLPASITASLNITYAKSLHLVDDMANRVYRAAGYYGSTINNGYYYNHDGYAHDNKVTAIDFFGYSDLTGNPAVKTYTASTASIGGSVGSASGSAVDFYQPVADYGLKTFNIDNGVTRNLLVYANSNDDLASTGALYDHLYNEDTYEDYIRTHVIGQNTENGTTAQAQYLHLVERTAENLDAPANKQYINDFCVPVQFNVTDRAWYVRQPAKYAENGNDAWEGIILPFTANKVEADLNGEITHFYGTATQGELEDPATNSHTLHHEYWLRGLVSISSPDGTPSVATATFQRPGTDGGLFINTAQTSAAISSYTFANDFFVETYGGKDYNHAAPQNNWYTTSHTYSNYLPLTQGVPYIVSFPGLRYYEFDLSSKFYDKVNNNGVKTTAPQTITFNAYGPMNKGSESEIVNHASSIVIPVTNLQPTTCTPTGHSYTHTGTYMTLTNAQYGINDGGTSFTNDRNNVLPFRTYMTHTTPSPSKQNNSASMLAKAIHIGSAAGDMEGIQSEFGGDPDNGIVENGMRIYPRGQRVIVESTYSTTLNIYTASGVLLRVLDVRPGRNTYSGFHQGIHIVGTKKLFIK